MDRRGYFYTALFINQRKPRVSPVVTHFSYVMIMMQYITVINDAHYFRIVELFEWSADGIDFNLVSRLFEN